jgi:superfamily II DNA or RNA helicase
MPVYRDRPPNVEGNTLLRTPQREAYAALIEAAANPDDRELGIVLPVGCGKSGLLSITPFAFRAKRVLVIAPNVRIAQQLYADVNPTRDEMFYRRMLVLDGGPFPEPAEIRGRTTNRSDLEEADVVVTNIQQLQGDENRWLQGLPRDFFDLVLFDEAHHNVAESWEVLRQAFPGARIVNYSATPTRADGRLMAGRIVYAYPVAEAIRQGYIKSLKAVVLNPRTLRYVRREGGREIEVPLEEVIRLGEEESDFRRSIVTSTETLNTIVDASIRELEGIRTRTGDRRHKIIASALNYEHCIQIVQAYQARGQRAAYVHSREGTANDRVYRRLENDELDVIVQVRKLGEGFDHPYLSVAAVFSIFRELAPFVQFVGRIMRAIIPNDPANPRNQGIVVYHAGGNIAGRWADFREFSGADQEYFQQLLPIEGLDFGDANELAMQPPVRPGEGMEVRGQGGVVLEELPLLLNDELRSAFELLQSRGVTAEDYRRAEELRPIATTRVAERQAARAGLDARIRTEVGRILGERGVNPQGRELDRRRIGQTNFVVLKAAIDQRVNASVGRAERERSEFTRAQLDQISRDFDGLVEQADREVFGG